MSQSSKALQNRMRLSFRTERVSSFAPKTFWSHFTKEFEQFLEFLLKMC